MQENALKKFILVYASLRTTGVVNRADRLKLGTACLLPPEIIATGLGFRLLRNSGKRSKKLPGLRVVLRSIELEDTNFRARNDENVKS